MSDRCLRLLGISIVGSVLLLATGCTNTLRELRGVNYLDYGHYDLAIEDFTEVIQRDPANAEAYYKTTFRGRMRNAYYRPNPVV